MDNDVATFAAVMVILVPSFAAVVGTIVLSIKALRRNNDPQLARAPVDNERMARLEQAVDAIAVELERVGESQRYLTQIMSQRLPASNASSAASDVQRGRVITPH